MATGKCFFTGEEVELTPVGNKDYRYRSSEWEYCITNDALRKYETSPLSDLEKINCLSEIISLNRQNRVPVFIPIKKNNCEGDSHFIEKTLKELKDVPINHKEKSIKILKLLAEKLLKKTNPFSFSKLDRSDRYFLKVFTDFEYLDWINHLKDKNLIEFSDNIQNDFKNQKFRGGKERFLGSINRSNSIKLTPNGWDIIYEYSRGIKSNDVFVAMAFTDADKNNVDPELASIIQKTLKTIGWNAIPINQKEYNDGIMDQVIKSIKESAFVIAELTHHKMGVYYEAGFAKGMGLPVIHLVKEDHLQSCHFDVKHLNLIVWKDHDDLAKKLENRVLATIGKHS